MFQLQNSTFNAKLVNHGTLGVAYVPHVEQQSCRGLNETQDKLKNLAHQMEFLRVLKRLTGCRGTLSPNYRQCGDPDGSYLEPPCSAYHQSVTFFSLSLRPQKKKAHPFLSLSQMLALLLLLLQGFPTIFFLIWQFYALIQVLSGSGWCQDENTSSRAITEAKHIELNRSSEG